MQLSSTPPKENMTTTSEALIPESPFGKNPPRSTRWAKLGSGRLEPELTAKPMTTAPRTIMPTMATTLTRANQNSNSPKDRTPTRLTAVMDTRTIAAVSQSGIPGSQYLT